MTTDAERWALVQQLFHAALDLPTSERRSFLRSECGGDAALFGEVLSLLNEDTRSDSLLDQDLAEVAEGVLDGSVPLSKQIGPYTIQAVLGRGGMGVVYLAFRADLGSTAAIKVLRDASLSPARRARFAAEQRTLAQLTHPAIARLLDADVLPDGTPYFVMEHVEGQPLTDYLSEHPTSLEDRLRLFRAVCEAVQAAHARAVIHRDLKPSNVLVTADGEPRLLDFGIAKRLDDLERPRSQTETGLRLMTPAYAAPEQVVGGPVGTHTDIYALGVIFYQMLTGRLPFELSSQTPGQAEATILKQEPLRPSDAAQRDDPENARTFAPVSAGRAGWADLDVLCLNAMHKDPGRRYPTVDALVRDIDRFLASEPLEARPDGVAYRVEKLVRRRWRPLAAAAAAAAVLIGMATFYTVRLAAARDAAEDEAARAQRIQRFTMSLFSGGQAEVGPADSLRVVTLIDRGVREAAVLDAEPEVQAELFQTLGSLYHQLGDLDRADSLLGAALRLRRARFDSPHPEIARNLVARGLLRVDQAELQEAEELVRAGLQQARETHALNHPQVLEARAALGKVLQERGEYAEAIAVLEEVVAAQSEDGASAELSASMSELANTHFYAGDMAASDSLNRRVIEMDRGLYGPSHPNVGDGLINLGAIQFQLGDYQESERLYREALEIFMGYYGPDHPETASNLTVLSRALVYQGRYEEAVRTLRDALTIQERVYGPSHPQVASSLNDLGIAALQEGDLDAAEAYFRRMVSIYDEVYDGRHYLIGLAQSNLASVHLEAGDLDQAEIVFREAIARFEDTLGESHMQTAIALVKLGRVLTRQERWQEAEPNLLRGHDLLAEQTSPSVSWIRAARNDLIATYEALGRSDEAARYRTEAADTTAPPGG